METSNAKTTRNTIEFYLLFPAIKYVSFEIVRQSKHNTSDGKSKIKTSTFLFNPFVAAKNEL